MQAIAKYILIQQMLRRICTKQESFQTSYAPADQRFCGLE
jgi:hypothetical protein